jgi:chaperone required for assembly of F1-ATPase
MAKRMKYIYNNSFCLFNRNYLKCIYGYQYKKFYTTDEKSKIINNVSDRDHYNNSLINDNQIREPYTIQKKKEIKTSGVRVNSLRWFKKVNIELFSISGQKGWIVLLDDRIMKTPRNNKLFLPNKNIAMSVAFEWDTQEKIKPILMPMMSIASTAIDIIPEKRAVVVDSLLSFLKTDTMCIISDILEIQEKQKKIFSLLNDWFSKYFKVPPLNISTPFFKISPHPQQTLDNMQWLLFHEDDFTLSALDVLANNLKSLLLSLAVWKKRITVEEAIEFSQIEEYYQQKQNGVIKGWHDVELAQIKVKVGAASFFLHLL